MENKFNIDDNVIIAEENETWNGKVTNCFMGNFGKWMYKVSGTRNGEQYKALLPESFLSAKD